MTPTTQMTVAGFVLARPAAARVLERFGIDYCCGGGDALAPALLEKGVTLAQIEAELASVEANSPGQERDWQAAPVAELIQHILNKHHVYLREELPRLDALASKVLHAHREKHAHMLSQVAQIFYELRMELESHMRKEEMILFPHLMQKGQAAPFGTVRGPIQVMEAEHDAAGNALRRLREVTSNYKLPPDACLSFQMLFRGLEELEADLHMHIHLENNILFPRAIREERAQ
jgi:regulator of cell morphogenesis and NO signaling